MHKYMAILAIAAVVLACVSGARADVVVDTVPVGNPGNAGEWSGENYGGSGPDRICGAVDYTYNIGKFEVTAGQYCEFLNAVAATDTYGLYNVYMWESDLGCKIMRSSSPGDYTYSVAPDWENRAVNFVSWGDVARFANWLYNGQPTGSQDLDTTESGSYFLDGATTSLELSAITREADATWVIPSEDEWYKAAYHYNDGVTGNYFDYPTTNDTVPSNYLVDPDPGNNANFYQTGFGHTIGAPYWRTEVGEFENSESPYNTFDQAGNVWEWNEAIPYEASRGLRGGAFGNYQDYHDMHAAWRGNDDSVTEGEWIGFRVAEVPEPCTLGLLSLGGLMLVKRRRRT